MASEREYNIGETIGELQEKIHAWAVAKGWWVNFPPPETFKVRNPEMTAEVSHHIAAKLCLVHSEVSEALEALRINEMHYVDEKGKPEGVASELADTVIRVFNLASALGIDMDKVLCEKMAYNEGRPYQHGGRRL